MTKRFKYSLLLAAVALVVVGGVETACRRSAEHAAAPVEAKALWHCPMHPTYVSDKPGDCPICGMRLVPIGASPSPVAAHDIAYAPAVDGRSTVALTPERRQVLGVRSEPVRRSSLQRTIRTVGRVAADETRTHHVHTKYEAYIEHLYVDYTGKAVRKGQPLLALYSPDLVATQQEYLLAYRAQKQMSGSGLPTAVQGSVDLLQAARQRLLLWDIRQADIDQLERTGEVKRTLDLYSDVSGYVVQKMALHGMRVTPGDTLFEITDYSHLWVMADVYEADLAAIRMGMPASVSVAYLPGRTWKGTVTWIAPTVEEQTRTVKVRVEVDNGSGELKPEMFADVELQAAGGEGLVAPESAFLRSGERTLAFIDLPDGRLEPHEVRLGARVASGGVQVLSGLVEGDRVVTGANFLLDSESSLKAALGNISPAPPTPAPAVGARK